MVPRVMSPWCVIVSDISMWSLCIGELWCPVSVVTIGSTSHTVILIVPSIRSHAEFLVVLFGSGITLLRSIVTPQSRPPSPMDC